MVYNYKMLILSSTLSNISNCMQNLHYTKATTTKYTHEITYLSLSKNVVSSIKPYLQLKKKKRINKKKSQKHLHKIKRFGVLRLKKKKPYKKQTAFRYLIRPLIFLTGQTILFNLSLKKKKVSFSYHKFLKTNSIKHVSKVMYFCLVIKEPSFFLIPYSNMLTDLDMFSHRRLLRLAQSSLYWFVLHNFGILLGFYFSCSGKISVGGNSRTRTMLKSYGYKSSSLLTTQTTNTSANINTVTGCLGLLLIFFY